MSDQDRKTPADSEVAPEKDEKLEDLEAGEDEAANVKGGGPKNEAIQPGSEPEDRL